VARFTATVDVGAPAARTWAALVDWPAHARWVPLTAIRVLTPSAAGVGARFVGRTGLGPIGFDDPMEVTEWQPPSDHRPGRCSVVKQGRIVLGSAWFEVAPMPAGRSRVTWTEEIELAPAALTRPFAALVAAVGRIAFTRTLRAMAAEVERTAREDSLGGDSG
jgi:Polyketide cyclase / dehydrase and lipid transport